MRKLNAKSIIGTIVGVILLTGVAYVVIAKPFQPKPEVISGTKPGATLGDLYKQAREYMDEKNWEEAKQALEHLAISNPNYKDVNELLAQVNKESLYARGKQALDQGDYDAAVAYFTELAKTDPGFKDVDKQLDTSKKEQEQNKDKNQDANASLKVGELPTGGPMDAIPAKVTGYNFLTKSWINSPIEANAAYRSKSSSEAKKIDIVGFGVAKYQDENSAKRALDQQKANFDSNGVDTTVNSHSGAYFGRYNALEYPRPAILAWRNKNWLFYVTIVPKDRDLPESTMLQTAVEFAELVKY